jgi:hypothetical protein
VISLYLSQKLSLWSAECLISTGPFFQLIPNQVTRFIGGPSEGVANDFKKFEDDSKQQISQIGNKAEGSVTSSMQRMGR